MSASERPIRWGWAGCLLFGAVLLFQWHGNATRGYVASSSLFYWWGIQWFDPAADASHGPLVLLVAAFLFWRNLSTTPTPASSAGPESTRAVWLACLGALALHVFGYAVQQTRLSLLALLLFLWGVARLAGGVRWGRAAAFPLAYGALAIPVSILQPLGFSLRLWVSRAVEAAFHLTGAAVVRNGTQLSAPGGAFQYDVAAACSGVRSLVALLALSTLLAYLRLPNDWRRWVAVLTAVPLAFLGNFLRVLAIAWAGHGLGQRTGERLHDASGALVFLVVWGGVWWVTRRLSASSVTPSGRTTDVVAPLPSGAFLFRPAATATSLLAAIVVVFWALAALDRRPPERDAGVRLAANGVDPAPLPEFIGNDWIGQRIDVTAAERDVLPPDTGYSRRNYVDLRDRAKQVFVSIVLSGRDRTSIHRPELCIVGQGWNIAERREEVLRVGEGAEVPVTLLRIERELVERGGTRAMAACWLAYWFVGRDVQLRSHAEMVWRSGLDRLRLHPNRWAYVVVQTPATASGREADLTAMEDVLRAVWPGLKAVPSSAPPASRE